MAERRSPKALISVQVGVPLPSVAEATFGRQSLQEGCEGEKPSLAEASYGRQSLLELAKARFLMFYVYTIKCENDTEYVGCTNDLKDRIQRHNKEEVSSTKDRLPIRLVCYTAFADKYKAYKFEKYLKSGSGRAFSRRHLI